MFEFIAVHGGIFHADDVACVALAKIMWPGIKVLRVNSVESLPQNTIVCDIGFGEFDHHQNPAPRWDDGSFAAACGRLFVAKFYDSDIFPSEEEADEFYWTYISPIEEQDTGGKRNPLSEAIKALNPSWDSQETTEDAFRKAVDLLEKIFRQAIKNAWSSYRAKDEVKKALLNSDNGIVVLEKFLPWQNELAGRAKFVIFPSIRGGFNLQVIPRSMDDRTPMERMPEEITAGERGCTFIHPARFMASFVTLEDAVNAVKTA